jgi:hypothetical protein
VLGRSANAKKIVTLPQQVRAAYQKLNLNLCLKLYCKNLTWINFKLHGSKAFKVRKRAS